MSGTDQILERSLPAATDIEKIILGAVLLDNKLIVEAVEFLRRDDFFLESHRRIFDSMLDLSTCGLPIELATLDQLLRDSGEIEQTGGAVYLASLIDGVVRTDTIKPYAEIVKEKARARRAIRICYDAQTRLYEGEDDPNLVIEQAQKSIAELAGSASEGREIQGVYASLDALFAADLYEPEEIMCAVRRGEVTGLMAVTNFGKSTVLLNASLSLAAGEMCLPLVPSPFAPRRVLYLDCESPAATLRSDLLTMLHQIESVETARQNFTLVVDASVNGEPLCLSKADHFKRVISWAKSYEADLVIVDTAASAFELQDENSNAEVTRRVMNPLKRLAREANCAVVFTHHIGKANETQTGEGAYRGRGASAFGALARTIFTIERDSKKGEGYIALSAQKAKGEAFEPTLMKLNRETRWFELCAEKPETKPEPPTAQEIAGFVDDQGEARTEEIKSHFAKRASARTVAERVTEAERLGLISKLNKQAPWRMCNGKNGHFEDFPEVVEESTTSENVQMCNSYKGLHIAHSSNGDSQIEHVLCPTCGQSGPRFSDCPECGDQIR